MHSTSRDGRRSAHGGKALAARSRRTQAPLRSLALPAGRFIVHFSVTSSPFRSAQDCLGTLFFFIFGM